MSDLIKLKYHHAKDALNTLKEAYVMPFSIIVRDASIQRFEYTIEAIWKLCKQYLAEKKGIKTSAPKDIFRAIGGLGFLSEEETVEFLKMVDSRNETAHAYDQEIAQKIYADVKNYIGLMEKLLQKFDIES